jgi:hypothetical protein
MVRSRIHQLRATAALTVAILALCAGSFAQTFSQVLSFQGRLCGTDGKPLPDGPYAVRFTAYDAEVGGSVLWQEDQSVTQVGGIFTAYLGSVTPFGAALFTDGDRWLGIKVGGDPEMAQRFRFTPSPWAIYAANSNMVDSFHASSTPTPGYLLPLGHDSKFPASVLTPDDDWTISGGNIYRLTGNVGIGTSTPSYLLHATTSTARTIFAENTRASGVAYGVYAVSRSTSGRGVYAEAGASTGITYGLEAYAVSPDGYAVYGYNEADSGVANAVYGETASPSGTAIYGRALSDSGAHATIGVSGRTDNSMGAGVYGYAASTDGGAVGVVGEAATPSGSGVLGQDLSLSGQTQGVYGISFSPQGRGVFGLNNATTGAAIGVQGQTSSPTGRAVYGESLNTSGECDGVYGITGSASGYGVYGTTRASGGKAVGGENGSNVGYLGTSFAGIYGSSAGGNGVNGYSSGSWGVLGLSPFGSGQAGVVGAIKLSNGAVAWVPNSGVSGSTESGYGVAGRTTNGIGVYGVQDTSNNKGYLGTATEAVLGIAANGSGVYATSANGYAGRFEIANGSNSSDAVHATTAGNGYGVYARCTRTLSDTPAVYGEHAVSDYYGTGVLGIGGFRGIEGRVFPTGSQAYCAVYGFASGGSGSNTGVYGYAYGSGYNYGVFGYASGGSFNCAGYFSGNVVVTGTLSKGGGSFKIDHPLDPENKYLYHSFVESPDMMNVYNGNVVLDGNGEAVVTMPEWFDALNRDFRYQLTAIGAPGPNLYIAEEMTGNRFRIAGGAPGMKVSWLVTGIRQDPFANAYRIPVEADKPADERGSYLHPELYQMPEGMRVDRWLERDNAKADACERELR